MEHVIPPVNAVDDDSDPYPTSDATVDCVRISSATPDSTDAKDDEDDVENNDSESKLTILLCRSH